MGEIEYKRCVKGLWDTTISDISFDNNGISNYSRMQESLMTMYPKGEAGNAYWGKIVSGIKRAGREKNYDCIIGVSGGTDSSYLLHICKQHGLRPLAVNLDNGWNSDVSVKNIKKLTEKLNIDLETYVIDYEEVKMVLKSFLLAGLPWIDSPSDLAIKAVLMKIAARERIKYVLYGADFRSEGKQPLHWTYSDSKQLRFLVKKYFNTRLKSFPYLGLRDWIYLGFVKNIKTVKPLYYLPYNKTDARVLLENEYGWQYYGGHHHENIFTKFVITYWLPEKFNIDKRIITLSAQILSGEITREEALKEISLPSYNVNKIENEIDYVIKKLSLTRDEFNKSFHGPNHYFHDYPSYFPVIQKYRKLSKFMFSKLFSYNPDLFVSLEV